MQKKRTKLIILALTLVAGVAVMFFILRTPSAATFTGTIPDGVSKQQAAATTITAADRKLIKQAQNTNEDEATRNALLEDYKKAQILRHGKAVFFDLLTNDKQRIIIAITDNGYHVRKYLFEDKLMLINDDNKEIHVIENSFEQNVIAKNQSLLDPFLDNPSCLEVFEKRETSKKIVDVYGLLDIGYPLQQTMRVYETQNNFQTIAAKGTLYSVGTDIATIALTQKLALETLLNGVNKCKITIDDEGKLTEDTLFVTFKRQSFHHERDVTITNPMPDFKGKEVYIYGSSDSGIVEVNYRTPQFINTAKDIVASNIMSKPGSMEKCDEAYFSDAESLLSSKFEIGEFELWSDYDVGGAE